MKYGHRTSVAQVRDFYESDVVIDTFNRAFAGHWHVPVAPQLHGVPTGESYLCQLLGLRPEHHLLDFGSGVGSTTCRIAAQVGCTARGLNISRKQVLVARTVATRLGLAEQVDFDVYPGIDLPYPSSHFDRAIFFESVCNVPHKRLLFFELARVLKPGGALAGQDWLLARRTVSAEDYALYLEPIEAAIEVKLGSLQQYRELMTSAGFVNIHTVDARDLDPGLVRSFQDPPDQPVKLDPDDGYEARLWKGAQALKLAFHRGLFSIGYVYGEIPAERSSCALGSASFVSAPSAISAEPPRRCRLLSADAITADAYLPEKNLACVAHHCAAFAIAESAGLREFVRLVQQTGDCTVEPSCKVDAGRMQPARFNLFHHAGDHQAFLETVLRFFDDLTRAERTALDRGPIERFLDGGIDFRQVNKIVTGVDLNPRRPLSRAKLWFMLVEAPELVERAIDLQGGERTLLGALRVHPTFLVGFDLGFDGRTQLKLYPDLEPEELRDEKLRARIRELLSEEALAAMDRCVWTHVYLRAAATEPVLQLHPADPDDFVARYLPDQAKEALQRRPKRDPLAALVGIHFGAGQIHVARPDRDPAVWAGRSHGVAGRALG